MSLMPKLLEYGLGNGISIVESELYLFLNILIVLILDLLVVTFMMFSIYILNKIAEKLGVASKITIQAILNISHIIFIIIYILMRSISIYHIYIEVYKL